MPTSLEQQLVYGMLPMLAMLAMYFVSSTGALAFPWQFQRSKVPTSDAAPLTSQLSTLTPQQHGARNRTLLVLLAPKLLSTPNLNPAGIWYCISPPGPT